ncbi:MAG: hypothetical protein ISR90_04670 [Candidatus Marinimicrobia bacterium]|nr:hypothetical protein [Candidatus Neomarinimicrobiota bacterium]
MSDINQEQAKGKTKMKRLIMSLVSIIVLFSTVQAGLFNSSFKIGNPVSSYQVILGERSLQDKIIIPVVGMGYFGFLNKQDGSDNDYDFSVKLLLPSVGVRMLDNKVGSLNSYYLGELFLIIPFVSGSELSSSEEEDIKDGLDLFGLKVGYGVENYFSESFSIGGEISLNWIYLSIDAEAYDYDYETGTETIDKYDLITTLGATLVQITFSYYFN